MINIFVGEKKYLKWSQRKIIILRYLPNGTNKTPGGIYALLLRGLVDSVYMVYVHLVCLLYYFSIEIVKPKIRINYCIQDKIIRPEKNPSICLLTFMGILLYKYCYGV